MREAGEGDRVQADEGWTERVKRGKNAAPQTCQHLNSVRPDDCSTLWGLERLPADLCRALGRVYTRPSALPDVLLRWPGGQDARVRQPGKDGGAPRQLTSYRHTSGLEIEGMFQRSAALPDVERQRGTEHGGKAEGEEKAQKSLFRKTCMVW